MYSWYLHSDTHAKLLTKMKELLVCFCFLVRVKCVCLIFSCTVDSLIFVMSFLKLRCVSIRGHRLIVICLLDFLGHLFFHFKHLGC